MFSLPNRYFLDSKEEGVSYFRIEENTGVIRTTQPLDREDMSWHNITAMASEVGRYQLAVSKLTFGSRRVGSEAAAELCLLGQISLSSDSVLTELRFSNIQTDLGF